MENRIETGQLVEAVANVQAEELEMPRRTGNDSLGEITAKAIRERPGLAAEVLKAHGRLTGRPPSPGTRIKKLAEVRFLAPQEIDDQIRALAIIERTSVSALVLKGVAKGLGLTLRPPAKRGRPR